jgi:hypothetical protein
VGFAGQTQRHTTMEDEEFRRIRAEAIENREDMDLPTFLRRPVSTR